MTATSLFIDRGLPEPRRHLEPDSPQQLHEIITTHDSEQEPPLVFVGGAQHIRAGSIGERDYTAVMMGGLDRLIDLDKTSMIAHVEAGMRWHDLRGALSDRGASLAMYGLYPKDATIGGLLAMRHPRARVLFDGDIRDGLVSLEAITSTTHAYDALPAPRKSSGPDMRYLFVGSQGTWGAITSARLVVWPKLQGHLLCIRALDLSEAQKMSCHAYEMGLRVSWSWWDRAAKVLYLAVYWPKAMASMVLPEVASQFYPVIDLEDQSELERVRDLIEADHPGSRSSSVAGQTLLMHLSHEAIEAQHDRLMSHFAQLYATQWTAHGACFYGVLAEGAQAIVPQWLKTCAMHIEPVLDQHRDTVWSSWDQELKSAFDAERRFATGP